MGERIAVSVRRRISFGLGSKSSICFPESRQFRLPKAKSHWRLVACLMIQATTSHAICPIGSYRQSLISVA